MAVSAGSAFVDVKANFAALNKQIAGQQGVLGGKFGKIGKVAGVALVGGIAAAGIGKALYNVGKEFDKAYDNIRVGTGATGKALKGLQGDFRDVVKSVPASFGDASTAVADLNTRLGLTGKPLQERAKQFLELSRITKTDVGTNIRAVTRAFGDWEVATGDQAGQLDKFFRAAQSSGASVDELATRVVEFGAPLRQVGFSLDEATAMFASFEKAGVNTQTMMPGLKFALKTFMKEGLDPAKALKDTFEGIADGTIDTSKALEIFGQRAGADMVEAIQQGRFNLDELTKAMANGSDTIMKAGEDTMSFSEKWQMFKNRVLVALEPVAMRVFDGIGKAMDVLPGIAAKVIDAVRTIASPFVDLGKAVAGSTEAMIALAPIAGLIVGHFVRMAAAAAFGAVLRGLAGAFWALNAAMRANPIGMVITAVSLMVAGLILAYQKSETFRNIVQGAIGGVVAAFEWLKTAVSDAVAWLVGAWETLKGAVSAVFGAIGSVITGAWDLISAATSAVWGVIGPYLTGLWNGLAAVAGVVFGVISAIVTTAWNVIRAVTNAVWEVIKKILEVVWALIKIGFTTFFNAYVSIVTTAWNAISSVTQSIWDFLKAALERVWRGIKNIAETLWNAIKKVIIDPVRDAVDWVVARFETAKKWLGERWESIKGVARTAWNGIKGVVEKPIKDAVSFIVERFDKAKGWLQDKWDDILVGAQVFGKLFTNRMGRAFGGAANAVIGFLNSIIGALNKLFDVIDVKKIGKIGKIDLPDKLSFREAAKQVTGRARGGLVDRPQVLVGEEAPRHPEYVIPTNPAYRDRATALMASAAQRMGLEGFARGGVLGNADTFASVAKRVGAGPKSTLALFMAGVVESGMRNLSYGHLDSRGILQVRDATARGMGINNMNVAQVAHAFLTRGYWGKGGAMSLSRNHSMGAGTVAQLVQGSAFPGRYEGARGRALSFLKQARGKPGGLEGLLKGAAGVIGDVASALNPMDFIKHLPGIGKLPDWLKDGGRFILGKVKDFIKDKAASFITGSGAIPGGVSGTIQDAIKFSRAFGNWTFGPGQLKRSSGGTYHQMGRAVDFGDAGKSRKQMQMLYKALKGKYGKNIKELFYDPMGEHVKNGNTVGRPFGGHGDHIHLALAQGGLFSKSGATMKLPQFGGSFANGGIVPGAVGQPRTVIAHGGEQIGPPNLDGVEIAVYIGGERIDDRVDTRIEIKDRQKDAAWRAGIAT